jgi:hypothetical protein
MIPCFPANNSTDAHHCDIVSSCSSPSKQSSSHESKFSLSTSYRTTMDKERLCCYQHCSVIVCTVQYRHNIVYKLPILVFYVRWRISPHNPHMNPRRYDATIRLDSLVSSSLALAGNAWRVIRAGTGVERSFWRGFVDMKVSESQRVLGDVSDSSMPILERSFRILACEDNINIYLYFFFNILS